MACGYPRLLGDIGGTNARWAWQESADAPLQNISVVPCDASPSLYESAATYLASRGNARPRYAGIGIATTVDADEVRMTNHSWSFSIAELKRSLGVERCLVINDFTALAISLPTLGPRDLLALGGGRAVAGAAIGLLGPGTGLGVSGLLPGRNGGWSALSSEGGHSTLAPADEEEAALLAILRAELGHVSAESVLSGPGLMNLYRALCLRAGQPALDLDPSGVTDAAIANTDPLCVETVRLFASFLGNVAGNLALTLGSRGGLYIGGGIVPRLGRAFDAALFRRRFEEKGRFAEYLQAIPAWVITAAAPALVGVSLALDDPPA